MRITEVTKGRKKWRGPGKKAKLAGKTLNDFADEIDDSNGREFWTKFYNHNADSCIASLTFLSSLRSQQLHDGPAVSNIPMPALKDLRNFAGIETYKTLYRGIELDSSNMQVGDKYVHGANHISFWSPDLSWADAFVNWGAEAIVVGKSFKKAEILLDMHTIPFAIGPTREEELILLPGSYNTKIIKKY